MLFRSRFFTNIQEISHPFLLNLSRNRVPPLQVQPPLHLIDRLLDHVEGMVHLFPRDHKGRPQCDHIAADRFEGNPPFHTLEQDRFRFARRLLLGFPIPNQIDPDMESDSRDAADQLVPFLHLSQTFHRIGAEMSRMAAEIFALDHLDGRQARGGAQGVLLVGVVADGTVLEGVVCIPGYDSRERQDAAPQRFAEDQDVRRQVMFARKHLPGPAEPLDDLVKDQKRAIPIA